MIKPRSPVPDFDLPFVGGGRFNLSKEIPTAFTMIVAYRGLHCPICKTYLTDLNNKVGEFGALGVESIAVSSDTMERATKAKVEWELDKLRVAYGLPIELGRKLGLFASHAIATGEPEIFVEPGLFLIQPDRTLYAASIQTMPFARPHFSDVLDAIRFIQKKNYPARGEA